MKQTLIICCCSNIMKSINKNHLFSKKHINYLLKQNLSDEAYQTIEYVEII